VPENYRFVEIFNKEKTFLSFIAVLLVIAAVVSPFPQIAMWFGFAVAGYSAVANDSIQTIGTFIASNQKRPWYYLWIFMGIIFIATVTYSWIEYGGDVSHQRLSSKGFANAPTEFEYLQLAAPVILILITRLRMPVSTTFLLLSSFSTSPGAISGVLEKSLTGYGLAFGMSILLWVGLSRALDPMFKSKPGPIWVVFQWITSGTLWSVWIMQDAANIAIYLPRSLSFPQFLAFVILIFAGLGILFYTKGDKIQGVVNEKAGVTDIRAATFIDLIYAIILFYFKLESQIPMSTTWVFLGLLAGRQLGISITRNNTVKRSRWLKTSIKMVVRDVAYAGAGLLISLILATAANEVIREEIFSWFS